MSLLLDTYKLDLNIHLKADKSLLGLAIFWRQRSIVDLLLKHKDVDPNYRQQDTHPTPLMIAIDNGDTEMVELLLAHKGLNPNLMSKGFAPLAKAIQRRHDQMAQTILSRADIDISIRVSLIGATGRSISMLGLAALKGTDVTLRNLLDRPEIGVPNEGGKKSPRLCSLRYPVAILVWSESSSSNMTWTPTDLQ
jgi:ankyrin repeat protein